MGGDERVQRQSQSDTGMKNKKKERGRALMREETGAINRGIRWIRKGEEKGRGVGKRVTFSLEKTRNESGRN